MPIGNTTVARTPSDASSSSTARRYAASAALADAYAAALRAAAAGLARRDAHEGAAGAAAQHRYERAHDRGRGGHVEVPEAAQGAQVGVGGRRHGEAAREEQRPCGRPKVAMRVVDGVGHAGLVEQVHRAGPRAGGPQRVRFLGLADQGRDGPSAGRQAGADGGAERAGRSGDEHRARAIRARWGVRAGVGAGVRHARTSVQDGAAVGASATPCYRPSVPDTAPHPTDAARFDLDGALERARRASRALATLDRDAALRRVADALEADAPSVLAANAEDVARARDAGTPEPLVDRLALSEPRLRAVAGAVRQVADLPDPLGRVLAGWRLANGLEVRQVTVPFGVIGMIYESRPNVTVDAFALAFKAGSAAVLRGSADALASNRALVASMHAALAGAGVPKDALVLVDDPDRARVTELLRARGKVDLVIPRGGAGLIRHVVETAQVPVIETGVGNCHLYVHDDADLDAALALLLDGKLRRPGVCNALETLLVHDAVAPAFLARALGALDEAGVTVHGCARTQELAGGVPVAPATEADWATEYLGPELAVRVVDDLDGALGHIRTYGSQHSEAIVTRSRDVGRRFQAEVDAAVVYVNASTRFTDGFEFGFGAEIGISTQKLHVRGPMGLAALVTSKHLVEGDGQVRG